MALPQILGPTSVSHLNGTSVTQRRRKLLRASVVLAGAGEVGVHPAGRGPHVGGGAVGQADAAEPGEGGVAVPGGAVLVDVQDVGAGGAGGDGQVPAEAAAEPAGDLLLVGGGVA